MSHENSDVVDFYKVFNAPDIKKKYRNPNPAGLQHPYRVALVGSSSAGKSNLVCNIIDKGNNIDLIVLVAQCSNEFLYSQLKKQLGKKLIIVNDITELPGLNTTLSVKTKKIKRPKPLRNKKSKKHDHYESDEDESTQEKSDSSSDSDQDESERSISTDSDAEDDKPRSKHKKEKHGLDLKKIDPDCKKQKLIIFEDCQEVPKKSMEKISEFFTRGRNQNWSCIMTFQNFFAANTRTIRLNLNYIIFLRLNSQTTAKRILKDYALELRPEQLLSAFNTAIDEKSFLMIDLVDPNPAHRIRIGFNRAVAAN